MHWTACARIQPFTLAVLQNDYNVDATSWPDSIRAFYKELWTGDFDAELQKTNGQIPAHYDSRRSEMLKVVREQFVSLARALSSTKAAKAMSVVPGAPTAPDGSLGGVRDGDVTAIFAAAKSALEKKELVGKLNEQAFQERATSLQREVLVPAASWTSVCVGNGTEGRGT